MGIRIRCGSAARKALNGRPSLESRCSTPGSTAPPEVVRETVTGQLTRLLGRVIAGLVARLASAGRGPWIKDPTGVRERMIRLGMPQPDVGGDQVRQEPGRTGAVGQRVEHAGAALEALGSGGHGGQHINNR